MKTFKYRNIVYLVLERKKDNVMCRLCAGNHDDMLCGSYPCGLEGQGSPPYTILIRQDDPEALARVVTHKLTGEIV